MDTGSPVVRRRIGTAMLVSAGIGVVVALVGAFVTWRFVGSVDGSSRDALEVTVESLESVEDTIDLAEGVVGDVELGLDSTADALDRLDTAIAANGDVSAEVAALVDAAAPVLVDVSSTIRRLAGLGRSIDGALAAVSGLPVGVDYDPDVGFGDTLDELADELQPLSESLESTAVTLRDVPRTTEELQAEVRALIGAIDDIVRDVEGSDEVIRSYRRNAIRARDLATQTLDDLDGEATALRWLVLVGALNLALAQVVPAWIGFELRRSTLDASATERLEGAG